MAEIIFLGTGSAWRVPEHNCECLICQKMKELSEERTRSSLFVKTSKGILIDCGPDLLDQMKAQKLERPDVVLITHEHGDHFLGLDDLFAFKRTVPANSWNTIPVYASDLTWKAIEARFSYLLGTLIEKRIAVPGEPIDYFQDRIIPFKTDHGVSAPGSIGYVIETFERGKSKRIVYTSDFVGLPSEPDFIKNADALVFQAHWLNEPDVNKPSHMSFQRGLDFIRRWTPHGKVYLTHISGSDIVEGDPKNNTSKKPKCSHPLVHPLTGVTYHVPRCQSEWDAVVQAISADYELGCNVFTAFDGLKVTL